MNVALLLIVVTWSHLLTSVRNGLDVIVFIPCGIIVGSGKGLWQCPAQAEGTALWSPHSSLLWKVLRFRIFGPLGIRDGDLLLSTAQAGLGVERSAVFSISPRQGLLFFLSCLLGSSSSLFFLQKGRKAHLEHIQLTCHWWWLGPALVIGSLTVKRHRVGEPQQLALRNKEKEGECEILICAGLAGPSILSPCSLLPQETSGLSSHNLLPGRALLFSGRLSFLSTSSSYWMHEEASHPKEGKVWISRDPCSSLLVGKSRKREKAFSLLDPRQLCGFFGKSLVFFHPHLSSVGSHHIQVFTVFKYQDVPWMVYSWTYMWMLDDCCPVTPIVERPWTFWRPNHSLTC